jgi:methyl-accepting chemotaxis protein
MKTFQRDARLAVQILDSETKFRVVIKMEKTLELQITEILTSYAETLLHIEGIKRTLDIVAEHTRELVTSKESADRITELLNSQVQALNDSIERLK